MKLDFDCPHCKKDITLDADKMKIIEQQKEVENVQASKQQTQQVEKEPEVKEVIKEVVKVPSNIPAFKCKNGNCGQVHPNKDYTQAPKATCKNCGQFSPNDKDPCPWCGQKDFDELDEDDLEDMGIAKPNIEEHDHEGI